MEKKYIEKIFGSFEYEDTLNGSIKILGNWTKIYIVKRKIGKFTLWHHKLITHQLDNIEKELKKFNLLDEFDLSNGGGCFVPRHRCWDIKRALSYHSWGIAIDINPKKYPYRSKIKPNSTLIQIFKNNNFEWGGDWRIKDPMHFQIRKII